MIWGKSSNCRCILKIQNLVPKMVGMWPPLSPIQTAVEAKQVPWREFFPWIWNSTSNPNEVPSQYVNCRAMEAPVERVL